MQVQKSAFDWLLEGVALAGLLTTVSIVAAYYPDLPGKIPRHFDASGAPNGWSGRAGAWVIPLVALSTYLTVTLVSFLPLRWNLPTGVDRRTPAVQVLVGRMMLVLKLCTQLLFAYIAWTQMQVALGHGGGLGRWFLPAVLGITIVPLVYLVKLRKLRS